MQVVALALAATFLLRRGHAVQLQASGRRTTDGQHIKLFCFSFSPLRPSDEDLLPEHRKQMAACDGYRFFTDTEAPGKDAGDTVRVSVPEQEVNRSHPKWLFRKNMAGLTPAMTYLLQQGIMEQYDWAIYVELDHFLRPTKVRDTIHEMVTMLGDGSAWERSFVLRSNGTDGYRPVQPMLFAFGNAFVFNKEMIKVMKREWPLPGMVALAGCPDWFAGGIPWCEQDMVLPRMLGRFSPPIQMFGADACGRQTLTEAEKRFPIACWETFQNPVTGGIQNMKVENQLELIRAIADQGHEVKTLERHLPLNASKPARHVVTQRSYIFNGTADDNWLAEGARDLADVAWDCFLPRKEIPLIHHIASSAVLKIARELLGF